MDVLLGTVVDGWELVAEKGHLDDVDDLAHPSGMVVSSGGLDLVGLIYTKLNYNLNGEVGTLAYLVNL